MTHRQLMCDEWHRILTISFGPGSYEYDFLRRYNYWVRASDGLRIAFAEYLIYRASFDFKSVVKNPRMRAAFGSVMRGDREPRTVRIGKQRYRLAVVNGRAAMSVI